MWMIVLIWFVNFGISWLNAWGCGRTWVETKSNGGWPHWMNWMGRIMSYCGFTWCYTILFILVAHWTGYLNQQAAEAGLSLGYLIIIPQVLFTGIFIMLDSWAKAYRERSFANIGTAAWNTYAQIHNTYHAISGIGEALGAVGDFFGGSKSSSDDDDSGGAAVILVIVLVAAAVFGGILTTNAIINYTAGRNDI